MKSSGGLGASPLDKMVVRASGQLEAFLVHLRHDAFAVLFGQLGIKRREDFILFLMHMVLQTHPEGMHGRSP